MLVRDLLASAEHPRMAKELLRGYAQVAVFLEAVIEEVFDNWRRTLRNWWTVILHYPEERWHGVQEVVWRPALKELDDSTTHTPVFM